jgi:hypothetical protein
LNATKRGVTRERQAEGRGVEGGEREPAEARGAREAREAVADREVEVRLRVRRVAERPERRGRDALKGRRGRFGREVLHQHEVRGEEERRVGAQRLVALAAEDDLAAACPRRRC